MAAQSGVRPFALKGIVWHTAVRRGLVGNSRTWTTVLAMIATARLFKRLGGSVVETVYCEELGPGQSLVITHHRDQRLGDDPR